MRTLGDLEAEMRRQSVKGVTVSFGQSVAVEQRGTWFANGFKDGVKMEQVRADTLSGALIALLSPPQSDDLTDLLG